MTAKISNILFVLLVFNTSLIFSQSIFQKSIPNTISVRGLQQLDSNRIAIITNDPVNWDSLMLSIIDSSGNVVLQRSLNVAGYSHESIEMEKTLDGGLIILCHNYSCMIKIDRTFNIEWMNLYIQFTRTVAGGAIKQLPDSGYIICGYVIDSISDKLLFKTDKTGRVEWSKTYNSTRYENLSCIEVTPDGGFIFSGINGDQTSLCGIPLTRTDSAGNILWSKVYGNCGDNAQAISITSDGGFIICGGNDVGVPSPKSAILFKIDSLGGIQWSKSISSFGNTYFSGRGVGQMFDGNYFLGGIRNLSNSGSDYDIFLMKFDANGDTLWSRVYGSSGNEKAFHFIQLINHGFIIGGQARDNSFGQPGYNAYLLSIDSLGEGGCNNLATNFEITNNPFQIRIDSVIGVNGGIFIDSLSANSSIGTAQIIDLCSLTDAGVEKENHPEIIVFPNPTNDAISLNVGLLTGDLSYEISDSNGLRILKGSIKAIQSEKKVIEIELGKNINLSGTYLVSIFSGSEKIAGKQFIFVK